MRAWFLSKKDDISICGHTIGEFAFIDAGAVVTKDVKKHSLMVGNPARQIGWVCLCGEKCDKPWCVVHMAEGLKKII